jgi:hypothetical protein
MRIKKPRKVTGKIVTLRPKEQGRPARQAFVWDEGWENGMSPFSAKNPLPEGELTLTVVESWDDQLYGIFEEEDGMRHRIPLTAGKVPSQHDPYGSHRNLSRS